MTAPLTLTIPIWLLGAAISLASAQPPASNGVLPTHAEDADTTRTAIQALARGQTTVTLAVAMAPADSLQERINHIHLQMNLLGWKFVDQEFVPGTPGNGVLLLSYQR